MGKIKIAHIICDLLPGGGQRSTIDLIKATDNRVENYLILLEDKRTYTPDGIKIFSLCPNRKKYKKLDIIGDWMLSKKLDKHLEELQIDIAISHMEVTAKVLRFVDIKKAYYMRTDISYELNMLKNKSIFRFYKRKFLYQSIFSNQILLCISEDTKQNIEKIIKTKDIKTIYNPFDFDKITKLSNQHIDFEEDDYIIQIGSGFNVKRQDILLQAFSRISDKKIKLLLLGTSPYQDAIDLIEKLHIKDRVIFHPFVENPYPYIKKSKLLVISSDREGLPRVMVEALSLNTPVVSTDCDTGPREVLVGELNNYLAIVNDPDSLAQKIDLALDSYPKDLDKYLLKFDKNKIANMFIGYLEKI
jgi:glycosyltransferase involved in cell wall biosynthesis